MSIEKKREAIENYCMKRESCEKCPLKDTNGHHCYNKRLSDDQIEKNYTILFSDSPNLFKNLI